MIAEPTRRWLFICLLVGMVYLGISLVAGELAARAASHDDTVGWRLMAWGVSAFVWAAHLARELHLTRSNQLAAFRAAIRTAIGAFGLAAAALVHSLWVPSPDHNMRLFILALFLLPVMTVMPAYFGGLVLSPWLKRLV